MKTNRSITITKLWGLTVALGLLSAGTAALRATDTPTRGGASRLLEVTGRPATLRPEASQHQPMSCAQCKTVSVTAKDWTARGANKPDVVAARHLCGGCGTDWVISGHGKAKVRKAVHTCTGCGSANIACCVTSKGGHPTTGGMTH